MLYHQDPIASKFPTWRNPIFVGSIWSICQDLPDPGDQTRTPSRRLATKWARVRIRLTGEGPEHGQLIAYNNTCIWSLTPFVPSRFNEPWEYFSFQWMPWSNRCSTKCHGTVRVKIVACHGTVLEIHVPDSKVHGANMGPIWGRQDPGGPHVSPMNFAIWDGLRFHWYLFTCVQLTISLHWFR